MRAQQPLDLRPVNVLRFLSGAERHQNDPAAAIERPAQAGADGVYP